MTAVKKMNSDSEHTSLPVESQYLPPVSAFVRMQSFSHITIDGEESFQKSTWRNRCAIINANGTLLLTIPVIGGRGVRSKTKDVRIADDQPWQRIHWRSLVAAYGRSSFFIFYEEKFRRLYEKRFEFLIEFNTSLLQLCFEILHWEKVIRKSNSLQLPGVSSRNPTAPNLIGKLPAKKETGETENLKPYHQVFQSRHGFIPDASIADLIFNLGNDAQQYLQSNNGIAV